MVTSRHSAISSLRARATIMVVLRAPFGPSVRAQYHCASALSFWEPKEAPCELDQAAAHPGIARLRQPFLSPFGATFVRRAG